MMKISLIVIIFIFTLSINVFCNDIEKSLTIKETCQKFMKSMFANDKEGVLSVILPVSGAKILWQGESLPEGVLKVIKIALQNLSITEVKEGETVELPNGKSFEVKKGMVEDNKKLIWITMGGEKMPTPVWIIKIKGDWKVDASPFIAGRMAAKKVSEKRKSQ